MARNPNGNTDLHLLDYDYMHYPVESRFSPSIDMQELGRSMSQPLSQPLPPGMNQYRPRYLPQMHPQPEHSPAYYEAQPRYPAPAPRMNYPRPNPDYGSNYNANYGNPQMYPPMRSQSPVLYHLDPSAMPYIPSKYIPPAPGSLRGEVPKPRTMAEANLRGPPVGLNKGFSNPGMNPVSMSSGFRDFVPKSRSPVPTFHLGPNKRSMPTDGITEEDRKTYGMEKMVDNVRAEKGFIGQLERGIDVTSLGLNLKSEE